jgi:hypothetical protein
MNNLVSLGRNQTRNARLFFLKYNTLNLKYF